MTTMRINVCAHRTTAGWRPTLRSLALHDERFVEASLGMGGGTIEVSRPGRKTHALVRLAGTLGTLVAMAPTLGFARVVAAAPELAPALGYDLDAAFEATELDES
jgi:hypothetical protein